MDNAPTGRWAVLLSFPLILLLVVGSGSGFLRPAIYANEPRIGVAQLAGADGLNLAVVAPVLLVAAIFSLRGRRGARLVWAGTVLYVVYAFIYYTLTSHFNSLFFLYCAVLGLAFYALVAALPSISITDAAKRYTRRLPALATAILFLFIALGATMNWMKEMIPASLAGQAPPRIREAGQLTEPAAVLDLAFVLPGLILCAILLLRRRPLGFVLGPILLTFVAFVALLLAALGMAMQSYGFGAAFGWIWANVGLAGLAAVLLALFLRGAKPTKPPGEKNGLADGIPATTQGSAAAGEAEPRRAPTLESTAPR